MIGVPNLASYLIPSAFVFAGPDGNRIDVGQHTR
jgi:hypothetical protein